MVFLLRTTYALNIYQTQQVSLLLSEMNIQECKSVFLIGFLVAAMWLNKTGKLRHM